MSALTANDVAMVAASQPAIKLAAEDSGEPFDLSDAHDNLDYVLTLFLTLMIDASERVTDPRDVFSVRVVVARLAQLAYL